MNRVKSEQFARHKTAQAALFLFSLLFFTVLTYGWYNMLREAGWFVALAGGAVIAGLAWFLARWIGSTPGGPWAKNSNYLLMGGLLAISAAGVYNTMMVANEGKQILIDTTSSAQEAFTLLETAANTELEEKGVNDRVGRIHNLRDALFSEIDNPMICGEGPAARRLIGSLQRELPGFVPLSGGRRGCDDNEAIIRDYNQKIDGLIDRASWNDQSASQVKRDAGVAYRKLDELRDDISANYNPERISQYVSALESADTDFRRLRRELGSNVNTDGIPSALALVSVESLGDVTKIIPLFLSRIGYVSTWVYLGMAFLFDYFIVTLFSIVTGSRVRRSVASGTWGGGI